MDNNQRLKGIVNILASVQSPYFKQAKLILELPDPNVRFDRLVEVSDPIDWSILDEFWTTSFFAPAILSIGTAVPDAPPYRVWGSSAQASIGSLLKENIPEWLPLVQSQGQLEILSM